MEGNTLQSRVGLGIEIAGKPLDLSTHARPGEQIIRALLFAAAMLSVLTTIGIVIVLGTQAAGFFDSRAWVFARLPVAEAEAIATLNTALTETSTAITLTYTQDSRVLQANQYIQIGSETMRITERGRNTLTVTRALDETVAVAHEADALIVPMREEQIRIVEAIDTSSTTLILAEGFGHLFDVGDELQMDDLEEMVVTDVQGDILTVARAANGTVAYAHRVGSVISVPDEVTFWEFLTNTIWQPQIGEFGIWPLLLATLLTSAVGLAVAIPLGLGSAIYLSEYATPRVRNFFKPVLELLAGIPTVVYGFFALTFITPTLRNLFFGDSLGFTNMLAGGLAIGILITPLISSLCEDAISAVPRALREASYGLGATKLETTLNVILPAAVSGISAAIILAMSRAVGETMIVAVASGAGPNFTFDLRQSAETMTGHIARISGGDLSFGSIDYVSIFAVGAALFVVTFALNMLSGIVSRRLRERY
jgi:phosphate transport system permease protein